MNGNPMIWQEPHGLDDGLLHRCHRRPSQELRHPLQECADLLEEIFEYGCQEEVCSQIKKDPMENLPADKIKEEKSEENVRLL